jgi:pyrimidine-nucleoside phosphorylase
VGDKHSTGGIGDKTSFLILPMCIAEGVKIPMMAGRGLGHTGGTIDKIESLPGIQTRVGEETVKSWMQELGGMLLGQSTEIAPLDYRLYHLRDVTATVESIPLITASILSKKIAEGIQNLVMDVKTGSGAFLYKLEEAKEFAAMAKKVGKRAGVNISCAITNMDEPLGKTAGNAVELAEVLELLEGNVDYAPDTYELSLELSAKLVCMCLPGRSLEEVKKSIRDKTASGEHLKLFQTMIAKQGGSTADLMGLRQKLEDIPKIALSATSSGSLARWDTRSLGMAILALGGGRKKAEDSIDHWVGLSAIKKP